MAPVGSQVAFLAPCGFIPQEREFGREWRPGGFRTRPAGAPDLQDFQQLIPAVADLAGRLLPLARRIPPEVQVPDSAGLPKRRRGLDGSLCLRYVYGLVLWPMKPVDGGSPAATFRTAGARAFQPPSE